MLKLINLELRKDKNSTLLKFVLSGLLATAICIGLVTLIYYSEEVSSQIPSPGLTPEMLQDTLSLKTPRGIKLLTDSIIACVFVTYAGINYARYLVKDVANQSLEQLYTYPVSRVRLMYAKIILGAGITIVTMIVAKSIVYGYLMLLVPNMSFTILDLVEILTTSVAIALVGQIAMAVGIWRKSTIVTLVSAFLLAAFSQGNVGTIAMYEFQFIPYCLAIIGMGSTYLLVSKQKNFEFFN